MKLLLFKQRARLLEEHGVPHLTNAGQEFSEIFFCHFFFFSYSSLVCQSSLLHFESLLSLDFLPS